MAKIRRNLAGMKFGKLTAIEYKGIDKFTLNSLDYIKFARF